MHLIFRRPVLTSVTHLEDFWFRRRTLCALSGALLQLRMHDLVPFNCRLRPENQKDETNVGSTWTVCPQVFSRSFPSFPYACCFVRPLSLSRSEIVQETSTPQSWILPSWSPMIFRPGRCYKSRSLNCDILRPCDIRLLHQVKRSSSHGKSRLSNP